MKEVLWIPYPKTASARKAWSRDYGLNAYYAGKHWAIRKKDAEYWHDLVHGEIYRQNIRKTPFDRPVRITFWWNDRLDLSNHAIMAKLIEDSIKGYLIRDDSRKYVKEIRHLWSDLDFIKVEVEEIE